MALSVASVMVVLCTAGVYTYERAGFPDRFLSRPRPYATYTYSPAS